MPAPCENRPTDNDLRRLYVDEGWTAQRIADLAGVRKITALRWLRAAGVERRPAGIGLVARGIEPPTAEELRRMIHEEHLGYDGVAERYGVDRTAVPYWLRKHGIPRPEIWSTRRKGREVPLPTEADLRARLAAGQSIVDIGRDYGVSNAPIRRLCDEYGIEVKRSGWQGGRRLVGDDGHELRSLYEQRVCNWLHHNSVEHYLEPAYPWDRRYRADFRVGQTYIEVWGVTENEAYQRRKAMKIERCAEHGIPLIQINPWQFANGRKWWRPLLPLKSHDLG